VKGKGFEFGSCTAYMFCTKGFHVLFLATEESDDTMICLRILPGLCSVTMLFSSWTWLGTWGCKFCFLSGHVSCFGVTVDVIVMKAIRYYQAFIFMELI
jgi:membrane protein YqaA with SNARE-associated domain